MNVSRLIQESLLRLGGSSDTARLDVEVLMAYSLGWQRTQLLTRNSQTLSPEQVDGIRHLIMRRANGEPVAYIVGEQEFWSLPLSVASSTLIPRPETEHLVEVALSHLPKDEIKSVLDLGTGSGAIALAIASERPANRYTAVDFSEQALKIAAYNAEKLKIPGIRFQQSDWFSALNKQRFDLIVSNPPYIASGDPHLRQGDVAAEPLSALVSGADGLDDIQFICEQAKRHLHTAGWLMLEHGWTQAVRVRAILTANGYQNICSLVDFADIERLTIAQLP